ncbi:MAG: acetyltransferase [Alphaproteobacteria bacterium]
MSKIILWGIGQIAEVVHYYLTTDSEHEVGAFCVDRAYLQEPFFKDKPVVAFDEVARLFSPSEYKMAMPLGYKNLNKHREEKYLQAKAMGYEFITYISSRTSCDAASVGENTFILSQNDIQPFVKIGNNVIVWATSGIGHHTQIGDHCFLASPKISGATVIGRNTFIGTNATISENLSIGEYCIIGAGTVILKSVPNAKVIASKQPKAMPISSHDLAGFL